MTKSRLLAMKRASFLPIRPPLSAPQKCDDFLRQIAYLLEGISANISPKFSRFSPRGYNRLQPKCFLSVLRDEFCKASLKGWFFTRQRSTLLTCRATFGILSRYKMSLYGMSWYRLHTRSREESLWHNVYSMFQFAFNAEHSHRINIRTRLIQFTNQML